MATTPSVSARRRSMPGMSSSSLDRHPQELGRWPTPETGNCGNRRPGHPWLCGQRGATIVQMQSSAIAWGCGTITSRHRGRWSASASGSCCALAVAVIGTGARVSVRCPAGRQRRAGTSPRRRARALTTSSWGRAVPMRRNAWRVGISIRTSTRRDSALARLVESWDGSSWTWVRRRPLPAGDGGGFFDVVLRERIRLLGGRRRHRCRRRREPDRPR